MPHQPVLTVVLDGIGVRESRYGNAVKLAATPNLDYLHEVGIYRTLIAHGTKVGLPSDDDMGNSEVGHNVIGAGNVYDQGALLVANDIASGAIFKGDIWQQIISRCKQGGTTLHLIGLLSDGNVHSHHDHMFALMTEAAKAGVAKVRLHVLLDGRDVSPRSAPIYVDRLMAAIAAAPSGCDIKVASGGGRMTTTMDRYGADWPMVHRGWQAHVLGEAPHRFPSLGAAIEHFYEDESATDQFLPSFIIDEGSGAVGAMQDGDAAILCNFRGDRAIELSEAFEAEDFSHFDRGRNPDVLYAGIMEYDGDAHIPSRCLVQPPAISGTLGEFLATKGVSQFACSETQKYGHVTFFWNGNRSGYFDEKREEYLEIPSDNLPFNLKPWMKAYEITEATIERMHKRSFDCGRINLANGDMVGHTGDLEASIIAVATVDAMVGRLMAAADKTGYGLIITADHGNCDEMYDAKSAAKLIDQPSLAMPRDQRPKAKTSHTLNPVPFYVYMPGGAKPFAIAPGIDGTIGNIAATMLDMMGMDGKDRYLPSLITKA